MHEMGMELRRNFWNAAGEEWPEVRPTLKTSRFFDPWDNSNSISSMGNRNSPAVGGSEYSYGTKEGAVSHADNKEARLAFNEEHSTRRLPNTQNTMEELLDHTDAEPQNALVAVSAGPTDFGVRGFAAVYIAPESELQVEPTMDVWCTLMAHMIWVGRRADIKALEAGAVSGDSGVWWQQVLSYTDECEAATTGRDGGETGKLADIFKSTCTSGNLSIEPGSDPIISPHNAVLPPDIRANLELSDILAPSTNRFAQNQNLNIFRTSEMLMVPALGGLCWALWFLILTTYRYLEAVPTLILQTLVTEESPFTAIATWLSLNLAYYITAFTLFWIICVPRGFSPRTARMVFYAGTFAGIYISSITAGGDAKLEGFVGSTLPLSVNIFLCFLWICHVVLNLGLWICPMIRLVLLRKSNIRTRDLVIIVHSMTLRTIYQLVGLCWCFGLIVLPAYTMLTTQPVNRNDGVLEWIRLAFVLASSFGYYTSLAGAWFLLNQRSSFMQRQIFRLSTTAFLIFVFSLAAYGMDIEILTATVLPQGLNILLSLMLMWVWVRSRNVKCVLTLAHASDCQKRPVFRDASMEV
ncbi:hypothetical protein K440DRAFT_645359 [Wilcoxina mikolae CBS 423.85]|nr:hypothetical protein K440DRAFT_645359 [Wilcoxina mikolae CBS 423.85]